MRILIVCSKNSGRIAPFIEDQVEALVNSGLICDYFTIQGKGIKGYLKNRSSFIKKVNEFKPDLIHAHYGLSGLLANTQRSTPVVTTYHGSDINLQSIFILSRLNMFLSAFNIFVSQKNIDKSNQNRNFALIPCGVDTNLFYPLDKLESRMYFGFDPNEKIVLFAGAFNNNVKNPELAQKAISKLSSVRLLELKGYSRSEVAMLINAVDLCLMTSHTEGSPQFIKEAMACNCPIVSVPVGDVPEVIEGVEGCFLSSYNEIELSEKVKLAIEYGKKTNARQRIIELRWDSKLVATKISHIYKIVLNKNKN
jgi:glycosyltransferase involved in cell wall biosynthesis